jgi:hypothetical protein
MSSLPTKPLISIEVDLIRKFKVLKKLGQGGYGNVFLIELNPDFCNVPWKEEEDEELNVRDGFKKNETPGQRRYVYKSFFRHHRPEQLAPTKMCTATPKEEYENHPVFATMQEIQQNTSGRRQDHNLPNTKSLTDAHVTPTIDDMLNMANSHFGIVNESAMFSSRHDAMREINTLRWMHHRIAKRWLVRPKDASQSSPYSSSFSHHFPRNENIHSVDRENLIDSSQEDESGFFFRHPHIVRLYGIDLHPVTLAIRGIILEDGETDMHHRLQRHWNTFATFSSFRTQIRNTTSMMLPLHFMHHR